MRNQDDDQVCEFLELASDSEEPSEVGSWTTHKKTVHMFVYGRVEKMSNEIMSHFSLRIA